MKQNVKNLTSGVLLLLMGVMLTFSFSSCSSSDDENEPTSSHEEIVKNFKSVFFKDGKVRVTQLSNAKAGQYFVVVKDGSYPCTLFTQLTSMPASATTSYEYTYETPDGKCTFAIKGRKELRGDNILYATLYVKIPEVPEISVVEMYSEAILDSNNDNSQSVPSGSDPVWLP